MKDPVEPITLSRDVQATSVPYGEAVTLAGGSEVRIVQALGGSVTVRTGYGLLFRVDGSDADALGLEPMGPDTIDQSRPFSMDLVDEALRTVYDPEMSLNVVELGLVYRCDEVTRDDGTRLISIDMTMTAPGCGMGDVLQADAVRAVGSVPGVDDVEVEIVFDPPWSIHRLSEEVRLELGLL